MKGVIGAAKLIPVVVSAVIIVLVAVVQERSRELAAIAAVMPLTIPLAVWIVFSLVIVLAFAVWAALVALPFLVRRLP